MIKKNDLLLRVFQITLFLLLFYVGVKSINVSAERLPVASPSTSLKKETQADPRNLFFENAFFVRDNQWYWNNFDLLLGNNLEDGYISTETSALKITRKNTLWKCNYTISLLEKETNTIYPLGAGNYGEREAIFPLFRGLKADRTYILSIKEQVFLGTKSYYIGSFRVKQKEPNIVESVPTLNDVMEGDRVVSGKATENATLYLTMGGDSYRGTTDKNGFFSINLDQTFVAGTGITAYTIDSYGKKSEMFIAIVKAAKGDIGVNMIDSSDSIITGKTVPNVLVEASIDNELERARIFEGTSDSTGNFLIDLRGKTYPAGTQVTVTAFKSDGTRLSKQVIIYPRVPSVNTIHGQDTVITGSADSKATIELLINGLDHYRTVVDSAGNYRVSVEKLNQGDKVSIYQESNGMKSDAIVMIVQ